MRVQILQGGRREWWDVAESRMVPSATVYVPFGCPDWGETDGKRNTLCTFCALPNSVAAYREAFYEGGTIPDGDHVQLFTETFRALCVTGELHTVMVFNAGSFLAMPASVQQGVLKAIVASRTSVKRVVIESRAPLVTFSALAPLASILLNAGIHLTVRIGVETQDDHLRLKVLKKGHSRKQLSEALDVMRSLNVTSGGYVLLNPAPGLSREWSEQEAVDTIEWVLGENGLSMDEVYLGATCVGPDTPLAIDWHAGRFAPPSLRSLLRVMQKVLPRFDHRVHLLPFSDEPAFLAVPSNHSPKGLPESLEGAEGCDLLFHEMFMKFRATMDSRALRDISCSCVS